MCSLRGCSDRWQIEDLAECNENVEDKLITANEINDEDADCVTLVDGDKSCRDLVNDQNKYQVRRHFRKEDGPAEATLAVKWFHVHHLDVTRIHQFQRCKETNEE